MSVHSYHLHIYFADAVARLQVETFALQLNKMFPGYIESMGWIPAIGPHTLPNMAVHIEPDGFGEVVAWAQLNAKGLSILIHPDTGNEATDHLEMSMWLGSVIPYNMDYFEE